MVSSRICGPSPQICVILAQPVETAHSTAGMLRTMIRLQHRDACEVTGYGRDELHALIRGIRFDPSGQVRERVARQFSRLDLVVLSAVASLDIELGMKRELVADLLAQLRQALSQPRQHQRNPRLLIDSRAKRIRFMSENEVIDSGVVLALGPVFARVEKHLGAPLSGGLSAVEPNGLAAVSQQESKP